MGASAGCGKETARDLALRGATVIMANRNLEKSKTVVEAPREQEGHDKLPDERFVVKKLDLGYIESMKKFAEEVKREYPVTDILINNAGTYGGPRQVTMDGFESMFHITIWVISY